MGEESLQRRVEALKKGRSNLTIAGPNEAFPSVPIDCPTCATTLYPNRGTRPGPRLGVAGRALMWVAFLIAVGLFLMVVVAATMGEAWFFPIGDGWGIEWDGMGAVVGIVALFVGAIPALAIAWVAYRMPR